MKPSYTSKETLDRAQLSAARFFDEPYGPFIRRVHPNLADKIRQDKATRQAEVSQRRAEAYRLVKAAKSPTDRFPGLTGLFFNRPGDRKFPKKNPATTTPSGKPEADHTAPDLTAPGTWAVIEKRDWAGEHRLRMETRPGAGVHTPDNAGERITAMLTERGARKISESCYFMACQRGGFSTFATLTLTPEAREKLGRREWQAPAEMEEGWLIENPIKIEPSRAKQGRFAPHFTDDHQTAKQNKPFDVGGPFALLDLETRRPFTPIKHVWIWSVQKEASRFFEAANKMYTRGWQYQTAEGATVKVPGSCKCVPARRKVTTEGNPVTWLKDGPYTPIKFKAEPLAYLWVAENPDRIDEQTGELLGENPHLHLMMKWAVPYKHFEAWATRLEKLWGHGFAHLEKIKDPQKAGSYVAKAAGYLSKAQGKTDQGDIRGNRYGISSRARAPGWIETERYQVGMMGWLIAEAHELWSEKHGEKIQRREKLKRELEATNDAGQRQKIGKLLEATRKEIEPLPRISKYAALFKSEGQKDQFFRWARGRGWEEKTQCSLWLKEWRKAQWARREYRVITRIDEATLDRLEPDYLDVADWIAMADSGAVVCTDDETESAINDAIDYFESPTFFEQNGSWGLEARF